MRSLYAPTGVLLALYFVQGVVVGLVFGLKFITQDYGASESNQATMSIANYPYSFKFVWAGLVDSVYWGRMGRRKSWICPVLLILAITQLYFSFQIQNWLVALDIVKITVFMTVSQILVATLDICVDAWSLEILPKSRRGLQANCNAGGFSLGIFVSSGLFLSLTAKDFCQRWLGLSEALLSHATVLKIYSLVIIMVLLLISITSLPDSAKFEGSTCSSIIATYRYCLLLTRNKTLIIWLMVLVSCYVGLGPTLDLQNLKLVTLGIPYATVGWIRTASSPIKFCVSILLVKLSAQYPLQIWIWSILFLQLLFIAITTIIYVVPYSITTGVEFWCIVILSILFEIFKSSLSIGIMSYHASVSDPLYGGVYMSLLAAFSNLGKTWPGTLTLNAISWMDEKYPQFNQTKSELKETLDHPIWDNYTTLSVISSILGILWLLLSRKLIILYQAKRAEDFAAKSNENNRLLGHESEILSKSMQLKINQP